MARQDQRQPTATSPRLFDELFEAAQRLAMQVMPIANEQRDRLLAAVHHFQEGPLTLFRYAREVPVFVRSQIVIQRQFQDIERYPRHEAFCAGPLDSWNGDLHDPQIVQQGTQDFHAGQERIVNGLLGIRRLRHVGEGMQPSPRPDDWVLKGGRYALCGARPRFQ
jgi:hypothetical protein